MRVAKFILLIMFVTIVIAGCKKTDEYSDTPDITIKTLAVNKSPDTGFDSTASLVVTFIDGDGDLGTSTYGGVPNNFIIHLFEKRNGAWIQNSTDYSGHLPYLTPTGSKKALKGEIAHEIFFPFSQTQDTCRYEIYILDRAMHQSKTITTPEIVITTN